MGGEGFTYLQVGVGWLVGWFGFDMIIMKGVKVGSFCVFGLGMK